MKGFLFRITVLTLMLALACAVTSSQLRGSVPTSQYHPAAHVGSFPSVPPQTQVTSATDVTPSTWHSAHPFSRFSIGPNCILSHWGAWLPCPATCGAAFGLQRSLYRHILRPQRWGGLACPPTMQRATCHGLPPCPVDCKVSGFGMRTCTRSCGRGVSQRWRRITQLSAHGGMHCPALHEFGYDCNSWPCATDCVVSSFTAWQPNNCDTGTRSRERFVIKQATWGGKACPPLINIATCQDQYRLDCKVGAFGPWSACSQDCDADCGGVIIRRREVTKLADFGGMACPFIYEARSCSHDPNSQAIRVLSD